MPGTDLTIVAYGTPVHFALEAAQASRREGKSVEVIDLRSLVPLDLEAIAGSVRKTSRLLVAHEDKVHGGFGGEVASQIQEAAFPWLDAPIGRVGSAFTPVGFNRILERAILPNTERCSRPPGRSWRTDPSPSPGNAGRQDAPAAVTSRFPVLFAAGAASASDRAETVYEGFEYGNLSLRTFALR